MKFYCDSCGAKYLIGDEKVRGKVLRIRCKKCEHVITVREPTAPAESGAVQQLQRKLNQRSVEAAPGAAVWYYSVSGQTFGPMPLEEIRDKFRERELGDETYLWHESFSAWTPARECDVVKDLFQEGSVRKPRNPTISLSTGDVRALAEKRAQELAQAQAGVPRPKVAASTGTSILKRANRNRSAERKPVLPAAEAQKPGLRRPLLRPGASAQQEVSPQDRIRALRERLRTNTGTQSPQGGASLRERLRSAGKPGEEAGQGKAALATSASASAPGAQVLKPVSQAQKALVRPPQGEEGLPEASPSLDALSEMPVSEAPVSEAPVSEVPSLLEDAHSMDFASIDAASVDAVSMDAVSMDAVSMEEAPAPQAEPAQESVAAQAMEDSQEEPAQAVAEDPTMVGDSMGIAAALEAAAQDHEALGISEQEEDFFNAALEPSVDSPSSLFDLDAAVSEPQVGDLEEEEEDILNPAFTTTGMFTAMDAAAQHARDSGGLRPISAQAQEAVTREDSVTSASLLIQLNNLKQAQRKRQMMFAAAAVALLMVVGVTGFVLFTYFEDSRQKDLANEAAAARAEADRQRAANKSNVDKRRSYDSSKLGELGGAKPKAEVTPEVEGEDPEKKGAKGGQVAKQPVKKNDMGALLGGDDNKLDRALASAGDTTQKSNGLKRDDEEAGDVSRMGRLDHNPHMATPTSMLAGAAKTRIEGREKLDDDKEAPQLPSTLDKEALAKGFKGVRRSVQQCVERHIKREGQLPKGKVKLGVTILKNGQVSAVTMDQEVQNTVFHSCMNSHRTRWSFPAFEGEPIQVRKSFVLQ